MEEKTEESGPTREYKSKPERTLSRAYVSVKSSERFLPRQLSRMQSPVRFMAQTLMPIMIFTPR